MNYAAWDTARNHRTPASNALALSVAQSSLSGLGGRPSDGRAGWCFSRIILQVTIGRTSLGAVETDEVYRACGCTLQPQPKKFPPRKCDSWAAIAAEVVGFEPGRFIPDAGRYRNCDRGVLFALAAAHRAVAQAGLSAGRGDPTRRGVYLSVRRRTANPRTDS